MKWGFASWWILMAFSVSLIFGFYHLTIPLIYKISPYSPLSLNTQTSSLSVDETIAYATKTQEILNGQIALSDLFIWEYKGYPSPLRGEIVPAIIMAGLAKLGGGIDKAFILADFISPAVSFLLLSRFFILLTGKKYFSIVTALMIMFFYNYFRLFPYLPSAISQFWQALNDGYPSPFTRSFHPQISFPFFMLALIALWQKRRLCLGIIIGLLFYTDWFYWTFMLAFVALMSVKNRQLLKSLILGLGIGIPYFINAFRFQNLPLSQSYLTNLTFKPEGEVPTAIIMLLLLLVAKFGLKNKSLSGFWQLYYAAVIVVLLSSKLIGFSLDDPVGHWRLRIVYPMTLGFLLLLVGQKIRFKKLGWLAIAGLLLIYQFRVHWQFFHHQKEAFYLEPERLAAFNWINQNTPKDSVILTTNLKDNLYLAIFTHANGFIPRSQHSLAPDTEALERFLLLYKVAGIPDERIKMMFSLTEDNQRLKAKGRFNFDDCGGHYLYFRRFIGSDYYNCSVSPEHLSQMRKNFEAIDGNLQPWKDKYRMDYWLWGPNEKQWAKVDPEQFVNWEKLWENQDYKIYALH